MANGITRRDFVATTTGLGFERGALVFAGLIVLVALAHFFTSLPGAVLFWAAYVLTRPLGASLGDLLSQSSGKGGLGFGSFGTSLLFLAAIAVLIAYLSLNPQKEVIPVRADPES